MNVIVTVKQHLILYAFMAGSVYWLIFIGHHRKFVEFIAAQKYLRVKGDKITVIYLFALRGVCL